MKQSVYKGVLFSLPDALAWFGLEVSVKNIVAKTRYWAVLGHTAVLRSFAIDRNYPDCSGCYCYDYSAADAPEAPLTIVAAKSFWLESTGS